MEIGYYDKDGTPLNIEEWLDKKDQVGSHYKRVAETTLDNGTWVSTVWLGIDQRIEQQGPPIIFETGVFTSKDVLEEQDMERYTTLKEAEAGHVAMVTKWTKEAN